MIKIKNFYKILLIIFLSSSLTYYLTAKSSLSYKSSLLKITISIFDDEVTELNNRKLFYVNGYPTISSHFSPKRISSRLNAKIDNDDFCERMPDAKKRNPTIKSVNSNIDLKIIFMNDKNLSKCRDKIKAYMTSQKIFYIEEVKKILQNLKDVNNRNYQTWKIDNNFEKEELLKELGEARINFIYNTENYIDDPWADNIFDEIIASKIFNVVTKIEVQNMNIVFIRFILFITLFISMFILFMNKELKIKIKNKFNKKFLD